MSREKSKAIECWILEYWYLIVGRKYDIIKGWICGLKFEFGKPINIQYSIFNIQSPLPVLPESGRVAPAHFAVVSAAFLKENSSMAV